MHSLYSESETCVEGYMYLWRRMNQAWMSFPVLFKQTHWALWCVDAQVKVSSTRHSQHDTPQQRSELPLPPSHSATMTMTNNLHFSCWGKFVRSPLVFGPNWGSSTTKKKKKVLDRSLFRAHHKACDLLNTNRYACHYQSLCVCLWD